MSTTSCPLCSRSYPAGIPSKHLPPSPADCAACRSFADALDRLAINSKLISEDKDDFVPCLLHMDDDGILKRHLDTRHRCHLCLENCFVFFLDPKRLNDHVNLHFAERKNGGDSASKHSENPRSSSFSPSVTPQKQKRPALWPAAEKHSVPYRKNPCSNTGTSRVSSHKTASKRLSPDPRHSHRSEPSTSSSPTLSRSRSTTPRKRPPSISMKTPPVRNKSPPSKSSKTTPTLSIHPSRESYFQTPPSTKETTPTSSPSILKTPPISISRHADCAICDDAVYASYVQWPECKSCRGYFDACSFLRHKQEMNFDQRMHFPCENHDARILDAVAAHIRESHECHICRTSLRKFQYFKSPFDLALHLSEFHGEDFPTPQRTRHPRSSLEKNSNPSFERSSSSSSFELGIALDGSSPTSSVDDGPRRLEDVEENIQEIAFNEAEKSVAVMEMGDSSSSNKPFHSIVKNLKRLLAPGALDPFLVRYAAVDGFFPVKALRFKGVARNVELIVEAVENCREFELNEDKTMLRWKRGDGGAPGAGVRGGAGNASCGGGRGPNISKVKDNKTGKKNYEVQKPFSTREQTPKIRNVITNDQKKRESFAKSEDVENNKSKSKESENNERQLDQSRSDNVTDGSRKENSTEIVRQKSENKKQRKKRKNSRKYRRGSGNLRSETSSKKSQSKTDSSSVNVKIRYHDEKGPKFNSEETDSSKERYAPGDHPGRRRKKSLPLIEDPKIKPTAEGIESQLATSLKSNEIHENPQNFSESQKVNLIVEESNEKNTDEKVCGKYETNEKTVHLSVIDSLQFDANEARNSTKLTNIENDEIVNDELFNLEIVKLLDEVLTKVDLIEASRICLSKDKPSSRRKVSLTVFDENELTRNNAEEPEVLTMSKVPRMGDVVLVDIVFPEDKYCKLCEILFDDEMQYKSHTASTHLKTWACELCGAEFNVNKHYHDHSMVCGKPQDENSLADTQPPVIVKQECPVKLKINMKNKTVTNIRTYLGEVHFCHCKLEFPSLAQLRRHQKRVHDAKLFSCRLCRKRFHSENQCRRHLRKKHDEDSETFVQRLVDTFFQCCECDEVVLLRKFRRHKKRDCEMAKPIENKCVAVPIDTPAKSNSGYRLKIGISRILRMRHKHLAWIRRRKKEKNIDVNEKENTDPEKGDDIPSTEIKSEVILGKLNVHTHSDETVENDTVKFEETVSDYEIVDEDVGENYVTDISLTLCESHDALDESTNDYPAEQNNSSEFSSVSYQICEKSISSTNSPSKVKKAGKNVKKKSLQKHSKKIDPPLHSNFQSNKKITNIESCPACPQTFNNSFQLKIHFRSAHLNLKTVCLMCKRTFESQAKFEDHSAASHGSQAVCNSQQNPINAIAIKLQGSDVYRCSLCGFNNSGINQVIQHHKNCHNEISNPSQTPPATASNQQNDIVNEQNLPVIPSNSAPVVRNQKSLTTDESPSPINQSPSINQTITEANSAIPCPVIRIFPYPWLESSSAPTICYICRIQIALKDLLPHLYLFHLGSAVVCRICGHRLDSCYKEVALNHLHQYHCGGIESDSLMNNFFFVKQPKPLETVRAVANQIVCIACKDIVLNLSEMEQKFFSIVQHFQACPKKEVVKKKLRKVITPNLNKGSITSKTWYKLPSESLARAAESPSFSSCTRSSSSNDATISLSNSLKLTTNTTLASTRWNHSSSHAPLPIHSRKDDEYSSGYASSSASSPSNGGPINISPRGEASPASRSLTIRGSPSRSTLDTLEHSSVFRNLNDEFTRSSTSGSPLTAGPTVAATGISTTSSKFECSACDETFADSDAYARHFLEIELPFFGPELLSCDFCIDDQRRTIRFSSKAEKLRHVMREHAFVESTRCCEADFWTLHDFEQHKQTMHQTEEDDEDEIIVID